MKRKKTMSVSLSNFDENVQLSPNFSQSLITTRASQSALKEELNTIFAMKGWDTDEDVSRINTDECQHEILKQELGKSLDAANKTESASDQMIYDEIAAQMAQIFDRKKHKKKRKGTNEEESQSCTDFSSIAESFTSTSSKRKKKKKNKTQNGCSPSLFSQASNQLEESISKKKKRLEDTSPNKQIKQWINDSQSEILRQERINKALDKEVDLESFGLSQKKISDDDELEAQMAEMTTPTDSLIAKSKKGKKKKNQEEEEESHFPDFFSPSTKKMKKRNFEKECSPSLFSQLSESKEKTDEHEFVEPKKKRRKTKSFKAKAADCDKSQTYNDPNESVLSTDYSMFSQNISLDSTLLGSNKELEELNKSLDKDDKEKHTKKKGKYTNEEEESQRFTDFSSTAESFISTSSKKKKKKKKNVLFSQPLKQSEERMNEANVDNLNNKAVRKNKSEKAKKKRTMQNNEIGNKLDELISENIRNVDEEQEERLDQRSDDELSEEVKSKRRKTKHDTDGKIKKEKHTNGQESVRKESSEDEEFEDLDANEQKLYDLEILLPWPVPKLHTIETRVANRPTSDQKQTIQDMGLHLKSGKFSMKEDKQIQKNFEDFCQLHDLPVDPSLFQVLRTSGRHNLLKAEQKLRFAQFLAHNLPDRSLFSVYSRFRRMYCKNMKKNGRFTAEEDRIIAKYANRSERNQFAALGRRLNRDRLAIEKRWDKLKRKESNKCVINWRNGKQVKEFLEHLTDVTQVKDCSELKDRVITKEEWEQVAQRLNLPVQKVRNAWFFSLYTRIFIKESIASMDIKKCLIKTMVELGCDDWRTVQWDEVAKRVGEEFEGVAKMSLYKILKGAVVQYVPKQKHDNLKASLKVLNRVLGNKKSNGVRIKKLRIVDHRQLRNDDDDEPEER